MFSQGGAHVSVPPPHFPLIDLHHVEQEADSNLHMLVQLPPTASQICWAAVQLVALSQHVEVTALVSVPDLHLVVAQRNPIAHYL